MDIDEKMKKGFENLGRNLEIYLKSFDPSIRNYLLTIFGSVTLENGSIMHATNRYHNKPWFSNVAIAMNSEELFDYTTNEGICYGQVRLLKNI